MFTVVCCSRSSFYAFALPTAAVAVPMTSWQCLWVHQALYLKHQTFGVALQLMPGSFEHRRHASVRTWDYEGKEIFEHERLPAGEQKS